MKIKLLTPNIYWGAGGVLIGIVLTVLFHAVLPQQAFVANIRPLRESDLNADNEYKYIDPLIGLRGTGNTTATQYKSLQSAVRNYISDQISLGNLQTASVMFSDISAAQGFSSINPDEQYNPASLLKVPTMIAYFKLAEKDPAVLSEELTYAGGTDYNLEEHIVSPIQLEKGRVYTIEQLIEHMIKYSDNNAAELLVNHLNDIGQADVFNNLFKDLGITQIDLTSDYITIQAYSLFFRVLYNSTYLSREYSEKALELLTQTDFSKGIDAGVPNNINVAGKFGEYTLQDQNGQVLKRELHNCGVVYYPHHPYIVCIMTKGSDFPKLESVISGVSRQIYENVEQEYPM